MKDNASIQGIAIIDKPAGWTSHDVVARARRLFGTRRVGHTGTLDPFATGVLVVLVGRATRLAPFLAGAEKEYEAVVRFGYATETGDLTGEPRSGSHAPQAAGDALRGLTPERIEAALASLRGHIEQVPPMYSAKKVAGRKLYELARRGEEIERAPVSVTVSVFEVLSEKEREPLLRDNADGTRDLRVRVVCSAGTYVRSLAESAGELLGTGAHLAALRRTRAGEFRIEAATTLEALQELAGEGRATEILVSPDRALSGMPFVHLTADEARRTRHGMALFVGPDVSSGWVDGAHVRLRDERGELVAVGLYERSTALVKPRVLLVVEGK